MKTLARSAPRPRCPRRRSCGPGTIRTRHFDFKRSNTGAYADRWLKVLMEIEHALIDTGILDDEFVYYVLKKKLAA